jgi:hypothetical protein
MELTGFGNGTLCTSHQLTGVEFRVSIYSLQQVVCFTFLCFRWVDLLMTVNFMMENKKIRIYRCFYTYSLCELEGISKASVV